MKATTVSEAFGESIKMIAEEAAFLVRTIPSMALGYLGFAAALFLLQIPVINAAVAAGPVATSVVALLFLCPALILTVRALLLLAREWPSQLIERAEEGHIEALPVHSSQD